MFLAQTRGGQDRKFPLQSRKQWEEPTPDLGGWALSVHVRHTCDNDSKRSHPSRTGQQRTLGRGLGRHGVSGTPGRCPTACSGHQLPASVCGPGSELLRCVLSGELSPCRIEMKPLVLFPFSGISQREPLFWSASLTTYYIVG